MTFAVILPISIDEWERGRTASTLESRLEAFLTQNRGQAFTLAELANCLYNIRFDSSKEVVESFLSYFSIGEALKVLMREGKVQSKLIRESSGEAVYYAATHF